MKTIVALLPFLAVFALAANEPVTCRTQLGTKPVKSVPTATTTSTNTRRPRFTSVIVPTVTKSAAHWYTITVFTTETIFVTDTTVTDTFSTTTTEFSVQTDIYVSTVTTTRTSTKTTSSVSTTVVATTAGFRNIRDTLNSNTLRRRDIGGPHAPRKVANKKGLQAFTYPVKVDCTKSVPNTKTTTVRKTIAAVTRTIRYWKSTTETDTISSTSTIVPSDVSITLTSTSTSSVTTTATIFETNTNWASTTTTAVLPGPTVYDACNTNNYFGPNFNNNGEPYYAVNVVNNGPGVGSEFMTVADGAGDPGECCYACQQLATFDVGTKTIYTRLTLSSGLENETRTITARTRTATKTRTSVSTVVVTVQYEDVYTTVITAKSTRSITVDATTTVVVTDTTIASRVSTSTIPTPDDFIPLASSLPHEDEDDEGTFDKRGQGRAVKKSPGSSWTKTGKHEEIKLVADSQLPGYPKRIICKIIIYVYAVVQTNTIINRRTKTLPAPTVTRTTTKTSMTTTTSLLAPASSTVTKRTTKVEKITITNLATSTSTSTVSTL
ncbi:hypothetical protein G7Z17_g851 [Cylindrodendrum hubeiense]|uniref:Uncharacterized protein n=1 Tax=Cylindrodendrum hubeiense TaxID=595255 RepID=A0A9P5HRG3_9HYPO|nr:hypothetical protein G7Z17_g851 [Cylindrodendrum hubeiense]